MAPKIKPTARTGEEGETSEAQGLASLHDIQNLRETVNQITASIQDRLERFQVHFETQEHHTSALRSTLDQFLRQFEHSTAGSNPVPTQLGTEQAPVGIQSPTATRSNLTGRPTEPGQNSSRASRGLQQIASKVGKYKPEQPKKFNLESGQEATALQIVTLKGQWKAFGMKQNWEEMEILATILTEGLAGKYYE
eukprot:scaffold1207_cov371-Pavlova_lutheri.AAC.7